MALKRVPEAGTYLMFVEEHLLKNEPCIFGESVTKNWKARRLWLGEGGRPDFDYLLKEFGMKGCEEVMSYEKVIPFNCSLISMTFLLQTTWEQG